MFDVHLQNPMLHHYGDRELSIQTPYTSEDELQGQGSGLNPCTRDGG